MKVHHFSQATATEPIYFTALEAAAIDRDKGVIRGVSVITSGITAKGHNLQTDETTLLQMHDLGRKKVRVPVKWNHKTGADAVNGYLTNFRIEENKLKADWHLLKTHKQYEHALELAERMPDGVGLSASFVGKNEKKAGKTLARCEDLLSVDLVSSPAANPDGLFEAGVDTAEDDMAEKTKPGAEPEKKGEEEVSLASVMGVLTQLGQRFDTLEQRFDALEEDEPEGGEHHEEPEAEEEEHDFGSLQGVVTYLNSRLEAIEDEREQQEFEAVVQNLEQRFEEVTAVNEQLLQENEVMATALQKLSEESGSVVEFTAGTDGSPEAKITKAPNGRELTAFETRVEQLKGEGKNFSAALLEAQEEDPARYRQHLAAKGAIAQEMAG